MRRGQTVLLRQLVRLTRLAEGIAHADEFDVRFIEVEDFPAFIVVDDKGNDFYADVRAAASMLVSLR